MKSMRTLRASWVGLDVVETMRGSVAEYDENAGSEEL